MFKKLGFLFNFLLLLISYSTAYMIPNDPNFSNQPYLFDPNNRVTEHMFIDESYYDIGYQYFFEFLNSHDMQKYSYRFAKEQIEEPVMAVLMKDFSLVKSDIDLNKLYINKDEIFNNGKDDDNDGLIDNYYVTSVFNKIPLPDINIPHYSNNHMSREDAYLSILLSKSNNSKGNTGIMIGGKVMLFDVSNKDNKINMEIVNRTLNYIYQLKHNKVINIRTILFPYNLSFLNEELKVKIKNSIRELGSVGITFIAPTYDEYYKDNFAYSDINYDTLKVDNPIYGLEDNVTQYVMSHLSPSSLEVLKGVTNKTETLKFKYEGVTVQDICQFSLLNNFCVTGINKNGTLKKDYSSNITNFVTGSYFKYKDNNKEIELDNSAVSSVIFAGVLMNSLYLYPNLFINSDEIVNATNVGSFLRSSSLTHEYEIEDLTPYEKSQIDAIIAKISPVKVEVDAILANLPQSLTNNTPPTSQNAGVEANESPSTSTNKNKGGIFGTINNMVSNITNSLFGNRNKNTDSIEKYVMLDKQTTQQVDEKQVKVASAKLIKLASYGETHEESAGFDLFDSIENIVSGITGTVSETSQNINNNINTPDLLQNINQNISSTDENVENINRNLPTPKLGLPDVFENISNVINAGIGYMQNTIANISGNVEYLPDELLSININSIFYGSPDYPGIVYNNMEKNVK